jgi:2-iminobutanoate/2-iminopropanoate deaminase
MADDWKKTVVLASESRVPRTRGPASAHAVSVGPLIFVTGQSGRRPGEDGYVSDPAEHARQTMENIKGILEAAGSSFENVIKRTVHVANAKTHEKMRPIIESYFTSPVASTTLRGGLMRDDMLLEVEVVAVAPDWKPSDRGR